MYVVVARLQVQGDLLPESKVKEGFGSLLQNVSSVEIFFVKSHLIDFPEMKVIRLVIWILSRNSMQNIQLKTIKLKTQEGFLQI